MIELNLRLGAHHPDVAAAASPSTPPRCPRRKRPSCSTASRRSSACRSPIPCVVARASTALSTAVPDGERRAAAAGRLPAIPAARPRLQGGGDRRRLCDRARARRILHSERSLGRHCLDAARHGAVQPGLHRHLPVRAGDGDARLSELLQATARTRLDRLRGSLSPLHRPHSRRLRRRGGRDRHGGVRAAGARRHDRAGGRILLFVTFGNSSVEKLFEYVSYLLYAVYRCSSCWLSPASATGSRPASRSTPPPRAGRPAASPNSATTSSVRS